MFVLTASSVSDMFPGIGLLLPLGFGQGPGQAYSIGTMEALGDEMEEAIWGLRSLDLGSYGGIFLLGLF